jgi:hypothetical protein
MHDLRFRHSPRRGVGPSKDLPREEKQGAVERVARVGGGGGVDVRSLGAVELVGDIAHLAAHPQL